MARVARGEIRDLVWTADLEKVDQRGRVQPWLDSRWRICPVAADGADGNRRREIRYRARGSVSGEPAGQDHCGFCRPVFQLFVGAGLCGDRLGGWQTDR